MGLPFTNLGSLLCFIAISRDRRDISVLDEFFALAAVMVGEGVGAKQDQDFLDQLSECAALILIMLEREPSSVKESDTRAFRHAYADVERYVRTFFPSAKAKAKGRWARGKLADVSAVVSKTLKLKFEVRVPSPTLSSDDINLALCWCPQETRRIFSPALNLKAGQIPPLPSALRSDYQLGLALSARTAEKAAAEFYRRHDFRVADVSATQLEAAADEWKLYDLSVEGRGPVDVKNSRRSKANPDNYVEHCVPKFKLDRESRDVIIFGVLSDYVHAHELLANSRMQTGPSILCLGETTQQAQNLLKMEFEEAGLLEINFSRLGQGARQFVSPWMFDYPDFIYQARSASLAELRSKEMPSPGMWEEAEVEAPLPLLIAAGIDPLPYCGRLLSWVKELCVELKGRVEKLGLSLPVVFLSLLKHFLKRAPAGSSEAREFNPADYHKIIFYGEERTDLPLCIYDPLKTVHSLINSLTILWGAEHGLIRQFRQFKLLGFNLLLGRTSPDEQWRTLIAYCGGWLNTNYGRGRKCGRTPLVLGQAMGCQCCGKLICPDCNYCSEHCTRVGEYGGQG
jgi:hypothetical protein